MAKLNRIQAFLRRLGGTNRYHKNGITLERVDRGIRRYIEGDHSMIVSTEILSGNPDVIVYSSSIDKWLPPFDGEALTSGDKQRILKNLGAYFDYYGETYIIR